MNRQTILASIDRHLREDLANTGEVRPLGEIVPLVAAELRPRFDGSYANPRVIPIEQVAAFLDGHLSEQENQIICDAVVFDNSVLAELIAAVRAMQQAPTLGPISNVLTERLLAMQPQSLTSEVASPVAAAPNGTPVIAVEPSTLAGQGRNGRRSRSIKLVAVLAIAATLLALVFVMSRHQQQTPQGTEIVNHDRVSPREEANLPEIKTDIPDVEPPPVPQSDGQDRVVVVEESTPKAQPGRDLDPTPPVPDPKTIAHDETPKLPQPEPLDVAPTIQLDPSPPTQSGPAVTRLANLRWTEITGLLTERNQPDGATGPQRDVTWKSVQANASSADESQTSDRIALRTLPLSRAEATLATGGRIVLAGDSEIQVTRSGTTSSAAIELQHGSVAMMNLPAGTVIDLRMANRLVATLRWQEQSSAVLQRAAEGLQIHIDRGTIAINDQPKSDDAVVVAFDQSIQSIDKPKRIPGWVDRPVENINVPRPFLAQLAESKNVAATLSQRIDALAAQPNLNASDSRTLATLTSWQAAMAGPNLLRHGNSKHAMMRTAALNRLVNLSNDDPRYTRVWHTIERTMNNQQRVTQLRRWCAMARDGGRPNAVQVELLLNGLTAREVAARALCDYLLRTFYGGGPVFDPTWTGTAQVRGVNLWRSYALRARSRAASPAALRDAR